jgi:hypothetical protein
MHFFVSNFKWLMLVSGLLTCSMLLGLFSLSTLKSNFGENLEAGPENIIVRNWSALIDLMGIVLIYGAFKPAVRKFSLIVAGTSNVIFIILILYFGKQYMYFGAGKAVIVDSVMVFLFILYLSVSGSTRAV